MSLSEDFPKVVVDQSAETIQELLKSWPMGDASLKKFCADKVKSGEWEMVRKAVGSSYKPAYRRTKSRAGRPR